MPSWPFTGKPIKMYYFVAYGSDWTGGPCVLKVYRYLSIHDNIPGSAGLALALLECFFV